MRAVSVALVALSLVAGVLVGRATGAGAVSIVSTTLSPSTATVGDRITLTVVVEHDEATSVEGPGFGTDFGGLEVVEIPPAQEERRDGGVRTTLTYVLTGFQVGGFTVPSLAIVARGPDGTAPLRTDPQHVTIETVLTPGDTSLRPLKPQLDLREPAPPPVMPVLFVAAFAGLTAFGYVLHRRAAAIRPSPIVAEVFAPPPTPAEIARARLHEIDASGLAQSDPAEYYARIAGAVRTYLSARFAVSWSARWAEAASTAGRDAWLATCSNSATRSSSRGSRRRWSVARPTSPPLSRSSRSPATTPTKRPMTW
jgi:hypothetical protein